MYCTKKITEDLTWIGANDRRLAMFEGVYSVPNGVSYNSYLLTDEKTVLFDTVDKAVSRRFMENLEAALGEKKLDYIIVQHMEPDHSAALLETAMLHPEAKIVCNARTLEFIKQFCSFDFDVDGRALVVKEGDVLDVGRHRLNFLMAPMVHWPEVMVTYDSTDKTLFSADAFGSFGALNGAMFADEVDFERDYMDEARRYYTNIVGKYGAQAQALLKKAATVEIETICPLHGFVWRKDLAKFIKKYELWSSYEPEEKGVMIAYASVYGNTENAAEILACRLRELGVKTEMFDVSVIPASDIVSAAFKFSHLVFASTTYNAGIFVSMEAVLNDLVSHNIQNRKVAVIENGSWAPASGALICEKLSNCKNIEILGEKITVKSALKPPQLAELEELAKTIAASLPSIPKQSKTEKQAPVCASGFDPNAMFKISYGLFVLTARENGRDNGCIINTAAQVTDTPCKISITVNKKNLTCEMIEHTNEFNVSVLSESAPFAMFERFGFHSGRDVDKFASDDNLIRGENGICYIPEHTNGVICAHVIESHDCGTHMLFIAEVKEAFMLSGEPSATYQYYFDHINRKPQKKTEAGGFVCKICGYVHEGDTLPDDFICPICKHGAVDFERL